MKQKFKNLGKILSRDAQKKLVGGEEEQNFRIEPILISSGFCFSSAECQYYWPGIGVFSGLCHGNKCYPSN